MVRRHCDRTFRLCDRRSGVDVAGSFGLLQCLVSHGGPQNYSFWSNAKFDALADEIDREIDPAKRQALIKQAEAIFEQDPPVLPVAWEQLNDVWYNYVKGHNPYEYFGAYDVTRWDTFWLDKYRHGCCGGERLAAHWR